MTETNYAPLHQVTAELLDELFTLLREHRNKSGLPEAYYGGLLRVASSSWDMGMVVDALVAIQTAKTEVASTAKHYDMPYVS